MSGGPLRRGRVHLCGASGTGQTTLGRALADAWSVPHADADDYYWVPSDPPYAVKREPAERVRLMEELFAPREAWVLSGSVMGWGEAILARCGAIVFLTLDPAERLARLDHRERDRRSGAIDETALAEFLEWAAGYEDPTFDGRNRVRHEAWLVEQEATGRRIVRLDAARPTAELVAGLTGSADTSRQRPGAQGP